MFLKSKIPGLDISFLAVFDRNFIELFDDKKKFIKKIFFSIITKNLNWEILTKNLVTFRRWDWVKYEKSWYYGGSVKNPIFRGITKNIYIGGKLSKKGWAWTSCRF